MKTVLPCTVMLAVVLISVPGYTAERLVPYDDFNAAHINPNRWFGGEFSSGVPRWGADAIRQVQDNRLRLMYRSYGVTNAVTGTSRSELVLMFRNPAFVTAMQASVTVTDAVAIGCPDNLEHTVARVALGGRFFGGAPVTPDDEVRDMVAFIGIERASHATDPPDVFRSQSVVFYSIARTGPAPPARRSTLRIGGPSSAEKRRDCEWSGTVFIANSSSSAMHNQKSSPGMPCLLMSWRRLAQPKC